MINNSKSSVFTNQAQNQLRNRFQPEDNAYLLDNEYWSVAYLRNFRTEVLAKTGDAEKRMLIVEYGLRVKNEKAEGLATDLTP